jgi:hypothetical protein
MNTKRFQVQMAWTRDGKNELKVFRVGQVFEVVKVKPFKRYRDGSYSRAVFTLKAVKRG